MGTDDVFYEPLEGFSTGGDQDSEIERSLQRLLADLKDDGDPAPNHATDDDAFAPEPDSTLQPAPTAEQEHEQSTHDATSESQVSIPRMGGTIQVAIPEMPLEKRMEYSVVRSDIVEFVFGQLSPKYGQTSYNVEFTDGRQESVGEDSSLKGLQCTIRCACCPWVYALPFALFARGLYWLEAAPLHANTSL